MHDRYSHRAIRRIALPLILSNLTVPLLGVVDTAVVGHLDSPAYLAAVAVGATVFGFLFTGFNFLRMGTTGLAAQALGARDTGALRTLLGQSALVVAAISALLIALQGPLMALALRLLAPEPQVGELAALYMQVRIWAAPAVLANFVLVGWFIGLGSGRVPLTVMLLVNVVNIALDLLFVLVFGWHVAGVAAASVVAEYCGLALAATLAWRLMRRRRSRGDTRLLDPAAFRRLLSVNASLLVRTLSLMFAFGFLTAQGARMGAMVLAANAVLLQFINLLSYALDGVANAAEALVGRAVGHRDRAGLLRALRRSRAWSLGMACVFSLAFALAGDPLIRLMTGLPEVRETAHAHLLWVIAAPLVCLWSYLYDGVFVGATRAAEMRNSMLAATFGVFVPAWYLLQGFGNHGLWAAFMLFMAFRGLSLHLWLNRLLRGDRLFRRAGTDGHGTAHLNP